MLGATAILTILAVYGAIGVVTGLAFITVGIGRVDPTVSGWNIPFRLMVLPGAIMLWPVIIMRWRASVRADHAS